MADVRITGLQKYYGSFHALKGIDLDIKHGEFAVFVGPSGCGKSTLLRTIAGLEQIGGGEIAIGGQVVNNMRPRDRDIAMVFQNYALYPFLTVYDNIAFGLRARKEPEPEVRKRVGDAAAMLDIGPLLKRYPRELSGGQRQRVAIGRAIVRQPQLFLFDEPLSNLDAKLRDEMRAEIKRLHRDIATTMIYVTHDQVEAMTLADRIVILRDGRIEQQGAPLDLFDRPATGFVAGFLGSPSINLIPAKLVVRGSGAACAQWWHRSSEVSRWTTSRALQRGHPARQPQDAQKSDGAKPRRLMKMSDCSRRASRASIAATRAALIPSTAASSLFGTNKRRGGRAAATARRGSENNA